MLTESTIKSHLIYSGMVNFYRKMDNIKCGRGNETSQTHTLLIEITSKTLW